MDERAIVVVDTNVLVNLASPVIDQRDVAPSGADPLKVVLAGYDVRIPSLVLQELTDIATGDDLLATAAELVLMASSQLGVHEMEGSLDTGLDDGESHAIELANTIDADLFVTDEFNASTFLLVNIAIADRNTVFTTPHLLCSLAANGTLDVRYVDQVLTYYLETKHWDRSYIDQLRDTYLHD